MSRMTAFGALRELEISAVVTRTDGTVEDLGQISYYHKNPLRRLMWRWRIRKGVTHGNQSC